MIRIAYFAFLGLIGSSFVSVLIHRGPVIWGLIEVPASLPRPYSLARPRSHCPHCSHKLSATDLIPLFGFLRQGGRCRYCGVPISRLYPALELAGACAGAIAAFCFAAPLPAGMALIFLLSLLALAVIDAQTGYLPDAITLPLIGLGLILSIGDVFIPWTAALWGAGLGYGVFWGISTLYQLIRRQEGLGLGDAKLLAAIGSFTGPFALPFVVLAAAISALMAIALTNKGNGFDPPASNPLRPLFSRWRCAAFLG